MLKKMIQNYLRQREIKEKILRKAKFEEIKKATEDFYIDLENSGAKIDLPYFLKAEAILNERIKSPADIDYYFNRLIKWRSKCA